MRRVCRALLALSLLLGCGALFLLDGGVTDAGALGLSPTCDFSLSGTEPSASGAPGYDASMSYSITCKNIGTFSPEEWLAGVFDYDGISTRGMCGRRTRRTKSLTRSPPV